MIRLSPHAPRQPRRETSSAPGTPAHAWLRRFERDEGGGPLVEFVIVLPLLLLLCFGAIEIVFVGITYSTMVNAARDASRQLAVGAVTPTGARDLALTRLTLDRPFTVVAADPAATDPADVSVTITLPIEEATGTSMLPLGDRDLSVTVVMRREG